MATHTVETGKLEAEAQAGAALAGFTDLAGLLEKVVADCVQSARQKVADDAKPEVVAVDKREISSVKQA